MPRRRARFTQALTENDQVVTYFLWIALITIHPLCIALIAIHPLCIAFIAIHPLCIAKIRVIPRKSD